MTASKALTILLVCFGVVLWFVHDTLLLVFAGSLLALILRFAAAKVARILRVPEIWAVWITLAAGLIFVSVTIALAGNVTAMQIGELRDALPGALQRAFSDLQGSPLGAWIVQNLPNAQAIVPDTAHLLTRATGILSSAAGAVAGLLIVVFVGVTGALEPSLYANGFVQLFPASYRERVRRALEEVGSALRTWLFARLLTMIVTAILVTIGLTILRIPLSGALGALAGLLAFIPNIGAFVAAAPAVVLAFVAGPKTVLAVIAMYVAVHILDDFIVGPFVERQVVKLPPILTLMAQVVLGISTGVVGIMLAAPLVAAGIVIVRRFWVQTVADPAPAELALPTKTGV